MVQLDVSCLKQILCWSHGSAFSFRIFFHLQSFLLFFFIDTSLLSLKFIKITYNNGNVLLQDQRDNQYAYSKKYRLSNTCSFKFHSLIYFSLWSESFKSYCTSDTLRYNNTFLSSLNNSK